MAPKVDDLKFVIMDEWSYNPPGGRAKWYYIEWSDKVENLMWTFDEVVDHVCMANNIDLSECDDDEFDEGEYDDEVLEMKELVDSCEPTAEFLKNAYYDNGGSGIDCVGYAEGKNIIGELEAFYYETFENSFVLEDLNEKYIKEHGDEFDEDEDCTEANPIGEQNIKVLKNAENNPEDYDKLVKALEMIRDLIE